MKSINNLMEILGMDHTGQERTIREHDPGHRSPDVETDEELFLFI